MPLTSKSGFLRQDVDQWVGDAAPRFVTRTINQICKEGLLERDHESDGEPRYRWSSENPAAEIHRWIDKRIHGDQVKRAPEQQRPRERLIEHGVASLSDADLLAILIRVGVVGESAITGGSRLATRFPGRIDRLRHLSLSEMRDITKAVTKASYAQILAGIELGRRIASYEQNIAPEIRKITSTADAIAYCATTFAYLADDGVQEEFHIVTLDTKHKPMRTHKITIGTLDASLVHPREVFRPAIRDAAAAVLLVHNHPSGDPTPSRQDHSVTERLTEAGKLIGIQVLDHVIVARQRCLSLRETNQ
ncbi:MAG: DNA repair protein RadC [Planctomycetota bacterium]